MSSPFDNFKKLYLLLDGKQKIQTLIIILLLSFGAILEMFGIGLIIPLLAVLVNGSYENNLLILYFSKYLDNLTTINLVFLCLIFIILTFTIKSIYLIFVAFYQSNYIYDIQKKLSDSLIKKYINSSYLFHLSKNPSSLINNTINETNLFSINVTVPLNIIFSEALVVLSLSILLLYYEPLGASLIFIFIIGTSFIFYLYTKNKIKKWGSLRQKYDENKIKIIQSSLNGIREIKIMKKENWFLNDFYKNNQGTAKVMSMQRSYLQIPRLIIEVLGVFSLFILILIMHYLGNDSKQILITLGLFSAIAFRIAPSVNKILVSFQEMRYASSIINRIHEELNSIDASHIDVNLKENNINIKDFTFENMKFNGVNFHYPDQKLDVLKNINVDIKSGNYVGIVGKSGAGKTTFLNLILGLLSPSKGNIVINDQYNMISILNLWHKKIGYVPQSVYIMNDTILSNIAFGLSPKNIDVELIQKILHQSDLFEFVSSLPNGLDTVIGEKGSNLSGGQIQRVGIARALYTKPQILILDESTSSLDEKTELNFLNTIKKLKHSLTIIFVTHKINILKNCDKVYTLQDRELN